MKVVVSADGKDLTSKIDPRFGRCLYFIIIETDDMSFEVFENVNKDLNRSAGIQSATFVASHDVKVVLTGNCGPKAAEVLSAANVEIRTGLSGTVMEVIQKFRTGSLNSEVNASVSNTPQAEISQRYERKPGVRGVGRCMGGGGRGMGMGAGKGRCGRS